MCVKWTGEWEEAPTDIIAFKAVLRDGKGYKSSVPVHRRDAQQRPGTIGKVLSYRKGRYAEGDEPGIYCFLTPAMARDHHKEEGIAVIKVKIPKGTRIRHGRAVIEDTKGQPLELLTINAMRIKVVGELAEKDCKSALWPQPRPVSDEWVTTSGSCTWTYFTATATTSTTVYVIG
jgi:hypothetical protein